MLVAETNFLKYEVDLTYNQFDFQCTVKSVLKGTSIYQITVYKGQSHTPHQLIEHIILTCI